MSTDVAAMHNLAGGLLEKAAEDSAAERFTRARLNLSNACSTQQKALALAADAGIQGTPLAALCLRMATILFAKGERDAAAVQVQAGLAAIAEHPDSPERPHLVELETELAKPDAPRLSRHMRRAIAVIDRAGDRK